MEHKIAIEVIDEKIAELVDLYRTNDQRIAALQARKDVAKDQLIQLLEQRGKPWSDDEGYARLTPKSIRASYDTSALDELILSDPKKYGWLSDYRKTVTISSRVQVR